MTDKHLTQIRFDTLALDARILTGLADAGFTHCTPIQAETLPIALQGRDIAGQAQTGTGKTAAFLLVVMQRLLSRPPADSGPRSRPRALILAPTRELAVQIHRDTLLLAKHTGLRTSVVYGGTGYQEQRDELAAGIDILIGTPGRLIDYFKQRVFDLKGIEVLVLDEADRMFDLGFIKDIRFLFRQMPPIQDRQGMLFSATLSYRVTELAYEHMNQPQLVEIEAEKITADRVRQTCYMTSNDEKIPLLIGLIRGWPDGRIIVFVNTKREADRVWGYLQGNGINTAVLSGDVPQSKRLKLLRDFTEGVLPVLVGTDVAARGLHIPDVTHVVNYDLPDDPEDYVHRIGRTARAGAAGDAIGFVCETHAFCLPDIETFIGIKIPVLPVAPELLAEVDPRSRLRPDRADREDRRDSRGAGTAQGRGGRDNRPAHGDTTKSAQPTRRSQPQSAPQLEQVEQAQTAEPIRSVEPDEHIEQAAPVQTTEPIQSAEPDEQAEQAEKAAPIQRWEPVDYDDPDDLDSSALPVRPRRRRNGRIQLEPAALTSPPVVPATPAEPGGDAESGAEAKPKRRRRRRKPADETSNQAPEAVD